MSASAKGSSIRGFYDEYHGHTIDDLEALLQRLPNGRGVIYLVGDSTMDNKYWLKPALENACNGYERCLEPARSVPDCAYWVNRECKDRGMGDSFCCINAAIEESTLGLRDDGKLLPQDAFVQQHLTEKDVIVVSMGGNDIALRPNAWTAASMLTLLATPTWLIERGFAPGLSHFVKLFGDATSRYLETLTSQTKPRLVVACMLYYLDEREGGSWADTTLRILGYNSDPAKLQLIIRRIFEQGTAQIKVGGVPVVAVPMYEALDGKDTEDYVQRVEPSSKGGAKLAKLIWDRLEPALWQSSPVAASQGGVRHTAVASAIEQRAAATQAAEMPASVHLRR